MLEFKIERKEIKVTGEFQDCYARYRANTRAVEALLPEDHRLCEDLWLHEGRINMPVYKEINNPEGFTLDEYIAINGYREQDEWELGEKMHKLPMNGNWSIKGGADTFNKKYAKLTTTAYKKVGMLVIPPVKK